MNHEGLIDFSRVRTYNLDEYVGLDPAHVCSYRRFMNENLFDHINIDKANTHVPCGIGADHEADAKAYDAAVEAAGGIDLQLLGIGHQWSHRLQRAQRCVRVPHECDHAHPVHHRRERPLL